MLTPVQVTLVDSATPELVSGLADVLVDCVDGGASVGFLAPLSVEQAREWWTAALTSRDTLTWAARADDGAVLGCVRLQLGGPANGRHRAEISKLLVHRRARGAGVATTLMGLAEAEAVRQGRTLLLLDTQSGSPAERLYARTGWSVVGVIDDYAALPDGCLAPTTIMTKRLREQRR
jgi:ribosomal protein S18 acetylase RimI-like enzyme